MLVAAFFELPIFGCHQYGVRLRVSVLVASLAASFLAPSLAQAACRDDFKYYFKDPDANPPLPPTPLQHAVPLGVGSSLNALMATMNTVNTAFLSPSSSFVSAPGGAERNQFGGGVWGRTATGAVESKSTTTATIDLANTVIYTDFNGKIVKASSGFPAHLSDPEVKNGTGSCEGTLSEDYYGYQFGFDLAKLNLGGEGANVHFGVTAGYFNSKTKDTTAAFAYQKTIEYDLVDQTPVELASPAGSFGANAQVPFVGLYAAVVAGNLFADALIRQDFYLMTFDDPLNGLSSHAHNAYGLSAAANLGYKIQLPFNWFIEPSGGALWSRVQVDPIQSPGVKFSQGSNAGTVKIDDIESILGRATVRVGTTFTIGDVAWQPFFAGTVFHEFADNATATTSPSDLLLAATNCVVKDLTDNCLEDIGVRIMSTSTSRIGTFAQYGLGTAIVLGSSGWLGYGRFDYRTGQNIEGYSLNAGLRYHW
jgi:hypothetical protein